MVTNDNIAMIVPNAKFIEHTVVNWSHDDPKVRFRIPIGVAYGTEVEKVCALLLAVAREHPQALADPASTVFLNAFGETLLDFELAVWSEKMSYRPRRFRSDLNFAIERKFREAVSKSPSRSATCTSALRRRHGDSGYDFTMSTGQVALAMMAAGLWPKCSGSPDQAEVPSTMS